MSVFMFTTGRYGRYSLICCVACIMNVVFASCRRILSHLVAFCRILSHLVAFCRIWSHLVALGRFGSHLGAVMIGGLHGLDIHTGRPSLKRFVLSVAPDITQEAYREIDLGRVTFTVVGFRNPDRSHLHSDCIHSFYG